MGEALEKYIIDSFSGAMMLSEESARKLKRSQVFSYIGNDSNPPDGILKYGAGIEIKKIENRNAQLQLNSSHPKSKLYSEDPRLKRAAREAEQWREKDFIYSVGFIKEGQLKELALIDASVYCADNQLYESMFENIKTEIANIPNIKFSPTRELGRVNQINPLGITSLRIRGMWLLDNPFSVYDYIYTPIDKSKFNLFALVSTVHFEEFSNKTDFLNLEEQMERLSIEDVKVEDPSNPAQLIDCKKKTYHIPNV